MQVRNKGGNTIPMVLVTTADAGKGISAIPYANLKSDMRKSVRTLRATLEDADVLAGGASEEAGPDKEATTATKKSTEDTPEFIQWENTAGKKITAAVKDIRDGKVLFHLKNGKAVWYDISKLSKASQEKLEAPE